MLADVPEERPALLVSACLLGTCCNHEGRGSPRAAVQELAARYWLVPVCPEVVGGLPTPRAAAEIVDGDGAAVLDGRARVVTADGVDVTDEYRRGAEEAVTLAIAVEAREAILKARSPSCGSTRIYDGTFSRTQRDGAGVTAAALRRAGLRVRSDEEL
jgi:uncharacterized protein YbbK (DUF523 family)